MIVSHGVNMENTQNSEYFEIDNHCDSNNFGYFTISTFTEAGQKTNQIPFAKTLETLVQRIDYYYFKQESMSSA